MAQQGSEPVTADPGSEVLTSQWPGLATHNKNESTKTKMKEQILDEFQITTKTYHILFCCSFLSQDYTMMPGSLVLLKLLSTGIMNNRTTLFCDASLREWPNVRYQPYNNSSNNTIIITHFSIVSQRFQILHALLK